MRVPADHAKETCLKLSTKFAECIEADQGLLIFDRSAIPDLKKYFLVGAASGQ